MDGDGVFFHDSVKTQESIVKPIPSQRELESFESITKNMCRIQKAKNHDYGDSFTQTMNEFGTVALAIRLNDKVNRIKQLIKSEGMVTDEKLEDTLLDIANYAVMGIQYLKNRDK